MSEVNDSNIMLHMKYYSACVTFFRVKFLMKIPVCEKGITCMNALYLKYLTSYIKRYSKSYIAFVSADV